MVQRKRAGETSRGPGTQKHMNIYHRDTEARRMARLWPLIPQIGADRSGIDHRFSSRDFPVFSVLPPWVLLLQLSLLFPKKVFSVLLIWRFFFSCANFRRFFFAFRSPGHPIAGSPDSHTYQSALICENLRRIWLWFCYAASPCPRGGFFL